jgi:hypothetical protein
MDRRARWTRGVLLPAILASFASDQRIQPQLDGKNTSSITVCKWGQLLHHVNAGPQTPLSWSHPRQYPNPARPYDGFACPSPVADLTPAKTFSMGGWSSDKTTAHISDFLLLINKGQNPEPDVGPEHR